MKAFLTKPLRGFFRTIRYNWSSVGNDTSISLWVFLLSNMFIFKLSAFEGKNRSPCPTNHCLSPGLQLKRISYPKFEEAHVLRSMLAEPTTRYYSMEG